MLVLVEPAREVDRWKERHCKMCPVFGTSESLLALHARTYNGEIECMRIQRDVENGN